MHDIALEFAGGAATWLELLAFSCALTGVALNALENRWGWPVSAISSVLYGWLFFEHRLYGDSALQLYFIAVSIWGWRLWQDRPAESSRPDGQATTTAQSAPPIRIRRLGRSALLRLAIGLAAAWLATGMLLSSWTDTDVPWWDAAPTVGSIAAQAMVARKVLQAWHLWVLVNAIAMALFAFKALWLTALLYALLLMTACGALVRWRRLCP